MKIKAILLSFSLLALVACSLEERYRGDDAPKGAVDLTTRGPSNGVVVLAFRKYTDNLYKYWKTLTPNWKLKSGNTYTAKETLLISNYEFLFYKKVGSNTTMTTMSAETTKMDDICFYATADAGAGAGYYKGVDEIWLPESSSVAHTEYSITGTSNPLVSAKITRAVSQVEVILKRGTKSGGTYTPKPFATGDISDIISSVELDISKIGTTINLTGGLNATAKTKVTLASSSGTVDPATGFITLSGPFVFPNKTNEDITVGLNLNAVVPADYPGGLATSATGKAERNRKLEITVWLIADNAQSISIEVSYGQMGTPVDGDTGIWE
ncbi:hypothetical protein LJC45_00230 [Alistipes sp. OttesenSCG-928-B03]|nr:hypothetical protein [Alistipes sp. OttesenSCG-928-B03]